MKRGEIWWAHLPPPVGRRPVLLLSRSEAYSVRTQVTIAPVTTRIRDIPVEVKLGPDEGLPRVCVANLDSITTIPKDALENRITELSSEKIREVEKAIRFALGLEE
ncbi:MAG: type II toxin-antitoxin system PemK/MazF family toxin [Armatimonadetes bacterium]|nr:type II toxin-antitoxin system PemK/MazF family toxin [Armatimonadota bacterium]